MILQQIQYCAQRSKGSEVAALCVVCCCCVHQCSAIFLLLHSKLRGPFRHDPSACVAWALPFLQIVLS